ncbi:MAG TPA: SDR family NAD(P)-dependent oxidoreductase [Gemmataceae bacterium]
MAVLDRFRLDGRRALITGGSRGLGRAIAQALAEAGAGLVLVGRDPDSLDRARQELAGLGRKVDVLPADVGVPGQAEQVCRTALERFAPIDVLVNNVGGRRIDVPTEELPLAEWHRILDLNLTSAFLCCKLIGGEMVRRRRGSIINVGSISGEIVTRGIGGRSYEAAKGALTMLTRALAADWAKYNVRVNLIAPGGFLTDPNRRWFEQKPELRATFEAQVPMGRLGEPEEIGPLAVYLAGDGSSYMTGAVLTLDGGYTVW